MKIEAFYTEDEIVACARCCFNKTCPMDGECLCDSYPRTIDDLSKEGVYYFIEV